MNNKIMKYQCTARVIIALSLLLQLAWAYPAMSNNLSVKYNWQGMVTDTEKKSVIQYLEEHSQLTLYQEAIVRKDDLDGDGSADYIIESRLAPTSEGKLATHVLIVLLAQKQGFKLLLHQPENQNIGIAPGRWVRTVDIDGDGLKDITDQRVYHFGGDDIAQDYALILRMTEERLIPVYSAMSYEKIKLEDLDNDGTLELIEQTNDYQLFVGTTAYWPKIYRFNGKEYIDASNRYPEFYIQRYETRYRQNLAKTIKENEQFKKKVGRDNEIDIVLIKVLNIYLERIEAMRK